MSNRGQRRDGHPSIQHGHQRGINTDAYRDPPFDYQKMMRYEPDMPKERYPWDHGHGPHGRDGRYGHKDMPGDYHRDPGYMKVYHNGPDAQHHGHGGPTYGHGGKHHGHDPNQHGYEAEAHHEGHHHGHGPQHHGHEQHHHGHHDRRHHHEAGYDENKGYIVLARFLLSDLSTFVTAVQTTSGILASSYKGYVIGFAEPEDITMSLLSHADHANNSWVHGGNYAVCCFWFESIQRAREFFMGVNPFKQHDFPQFSKYDIVGVPLTYGQNAEPLPLNLDSAPLTLLWTEFPSIWERYDHDFRENYSDHVRGIVREHGGHPNVTVCQVGSTFTKELNKFGQDGYRVLNVHTERLGRNIRGGWLKPNSFVTVSAFHSRDQLLSFLHDPGFAKLRNIASHYTQPTMVGITLHALAGQQRRA